MWNKRNLLLAAAAVILILLSTSYLKYRSLKINVDSALYDQFEQKLYNAVSSHTAFKMNDITTFEWDRLYVFGPYTTRKMIHEQVGSKWTSQNSFLSYISKRQAD
jgi:hypothetical protein